MTIPHFTDCFVWFTYENKHKRKNWTNPEENEETMLYRQKGQNKDSESYVHRKEKGLQSISLVIKNTKNDKKKMNNLLLTERNWKVVLGNIAWGRGSIHVSV